MSLTSLLQSHKTYLLENLKNVNDEITYISEQDEYCHQNVENLEEKIEYYKDELQINKLKIQTCQVDVEQVRFRLRIAQSQIKRAPIIPIIQTVLNDIIQEHTDTLEEKEILMKTLQREVDSLTSNLSMFEEELKTELDEHDENEQDLHKLITEKDTLEKKLQQCSEAIEVSIYNQSNNLVLNKNT